MRVYFDNAATTPIDTSTINSMLEAMQTNFGNPSSIHAEGRKARAAIEGARKRVANQLNTSIGEIFFTSGGTEANNMALKGAVRDLGVQRIISAKTEHHCVLHSLDYLQQQGVQIDYLSLDTQGYPDLGQLRDWLATDDRITLVSLMHANNEIGTRIDLEAVADLCAEYNAFFHTDTVQTVGFYPIDLQKIKIHFLSGSAHKFHGPKGIGFIYINQEVNLRPFIDGGSQERNMRGGTENLYGILGLAHALELACQNMEVRSNHIRALRDQLKAGLAAQIPGLTFNGDPDNGHYKILSASFPPSEKADLLLFNLDIAGLSVSGGSACSSGADAGSHVIAALAGDPDRKTIRFSLSHLNTPEEVDFALNCVKNSLLAKG